MLYGSERARWRRQDLSRGAGDILVLNGCLQRHVISEITYLHGLQVNHCTPYTEQGLKGSGNTAR